jgi:hypothetical protein
MPSENLYFNIQSHGRLLVCDLWRFSCVKTSAILSVEMLLLFSYFSDWLAGLLTVLIILPVVYLQENLSANYLLLKINDTLIEFTASVKSKNYKWTKIYNNLGQHTH